MPQDVDDKSRPQDRKLHLDNGCHSLVFHRDLLFYPLTIWWM